MSESATTDHQDPQKSVLLKIYALPQQTQAFTQQSTPAVYAFAVPAPTARPKITATAKTAFITTLLCALLRIMEFTIIIVTINSLHSAGEMTDDRYRGFGSSLLFMSTPLFLSVVLYIACGFYIFRGYDWARVVVSVMVFLAFTSVYIYILYIQGLISGLREERLARTPGIAAILYTLLIIYITLFIVNIVLFVLLWLPGTNAFMFNSKVYRLAQNPSVQPVIVHPQHVQPQKSN